MIDIPDFSQVYDLIDKINDAYSSVSSIDVDSMKTNVNKLSEIDTLTTSLDDMGKDVINQIDKWNEQSGLLQNIQQTITDINGTLDTTTSSITSINNTFSTDLVKTITDIGSNLDSAIKLLNDIPSKIATTGAEISTISGNIDQIDTVVGTLSSISIELIPKLESVKTAIESINIDDIQDTLTEDLTKIKTIITAVNNVKTKITDLEQLSEIDNVIKTLSVIPETLNTLITKATELKTIIPETNEMITTFDTMIENGNNLTGTLTSQMSDVLSQVKNMETYLGFVTKIHNTINNFAPSMEELQKQVNRLTSYDDIKAMLEEPIKQAKSQLSTATGKIQEIIDFMISLPKAIYELIVGVISSLIDILTSAITDFLPTIIVIIVLTMMFMYFYPIIIGIIM